MIRTSRSWALVFILLFEDFHVKILLLYSNQMWHDMMNNKFVNYLLANLFMNFMKFYGLISGCNAKTPKIIDIVYEHVAYYIVRICLGKISTNNGFVIIFIYFAKQLSILPDMEIIALMFHVANIYYANIINTMLFSLR